MRQHIFGIAVAILFVLSAAAGGAGLVGGYMLGFDEGYQFGLSKQGLRVPRGDDLTRGRPLAAR